MSIFKDELLNELNTIIFITILNLLLCSEEHLYSLPLVVLF